MKLIDYKVESISHKKYKRWELDSRHILTELRMIITFLEVSWLFIITLYEWYSLLYTNHSLTFDFTTLFQWKIL